MSVSAILLAAGRSYRLGLPTPKPFLLLGQKEIFRHSLDLFLSCDQINQVVLVCPRDFPIPSCFGATITFGGSSRVRSMIEGLKHVQKEATHVLIHDAARPFTTHKELISVIEAGREKRAAFLATPVKETIKVCKEGYAIKTPPREDLVCAKTPQVIEKKLLIQAIDKNIDRLDSFYDDVSLVETLNVQPFMVECSENNWKITTKQELAIAREFHDRLFANL